MFIPTVIVLIIIQTQEKAIEKGKQRHAQGGNQPLQEYLKRWRTWAHADLKDQVPDVNEILKQIEYHVSHEQKKKPKTDRAQSAWMKETVNRKGTQP